jgi:hypothetical protein
VFCIPGASRWHVERKCVRFLSYVAWLLPPSYRVAELNYKPLFTLSVSKQVPLPLQPCAIGETNLLVDSDDEAHNPCFPHHPGLHLCDNENVILQPMLVNLPSSMSHVLLLSLSIPTLSHRPAAVADAPSRIASTDLLLRARCQTPSSGTLL